MVDFFLKIEFDSFIILNVLVFAFRMLGKVTTTAEKLPK